MSHTPNHDLSAEELRELAVTVLADAKAEHLQIFDLRSRSSFADFMIIASGQSSRHVKAMADRLTRRAKEAGHPPLGVEGEGGSEWVLVDLNDIVVHLMLPNARAFYNLEKLWGVDEAVQRRARVS